MNLKHHDFIGKYLPIVAVSILIALFVRLKIMDWKPDDFFFNILFIGIAILLVSSYSHIILFGDGVIELLKKIKIKKNNMAKNYNSQALKSEFQNKPSQFINDLNEIQKIRNKEKLKNNNILQGKLEIAIEYTEKKFALYTSPEDLKVLCENIKIYAEKGNFENIKPIDVQKLSTLDIYHFGWNIWKHFKVTKQEDIAIFLKNVFEKLLNDVDIKTTRKHLKDDEEKGIIKIKEKL